MNRRFFLRSAGIAAVVAVSAPSVIASIKEEELIAPIPNKLKSDFSFPDIQTTKLLELIDNGSGFYRARLDGPQRVGGELVFRGSDLENGDMSRSFLIREKINGWYSILPFDTRARLKPITSEKIVAISGISIYMNTKTI